MIYDDEVVVEGWVHSEPLDDDGELIVVQVKLQAEALAVRELVLAEAFAAAQELLAAPRASFEAAA